MSQDIFFDAFRCGGSIRIECACGREHFANSRGAGSWEEDELESLIARSIAEPAKVVSTSEDGVSYAVVNGLVFCYGCPCGGIDRYQAFLDNSRDQILDYYRRVSKRASEDAAKLSAALEVLA